MAAVPTNDEYYRIKQSFYKRMEAARESPKTKKLFKFAEKGTGGYEIANAYSRVAGSIMSESIWEVMGQLPDERLAAFLAGDAVSGFIKKDGFVQISNVAEAAQNYLNQKAGIGLKAIPPVLNSQRVDGIVQSVASKATIEQAKQALESELDNYSQSIVDDSIRRNAEFQTKAGLKTRVIRVYDGKGLHGGEDRCQFCLDRAGKWTYEEATRNGVFQRHRGCGCVISYTSEKGNVSILSGTNTQTWEVREIKEDSSPKTLNGKTGKELEEEITSRSIIQSYIKNPGTGAIEVEPGYKISKHKEEIDCAEWIHDTFGGDVLLLNEINKDRVSTPDYIWNSKMWEHKAASSTNSIDKQLQKGMLQIKQNPGGVIIDLTMSDVSTTQAIETIKNRLNRKSYENIIDVILKRNGKAEAAIRSKK